MSGNTKGSLQPLTTSSGPKRSGRVSSSERPVAVTTSLSPEMVGRQFGWVKVINPERVYTKPNWQVCHVQTECTGCGAISWQNYSSLSRGLSKGCQACSQPRRAPKWLDRRLTAAKQRCTNPNAPSWESYGGRGVEFRFSSVLEACLWVMDNLGADRDMEIDRVDNNGHYEAGNLRLASRRQQNWNKRTNVRPEWEYKPEEWPYERQTVRNKIQSGMTREDILADAREAVRMKRKAWRSIAARLASMTS